jgi:uncharacterized DUF497 family protein
MNMDVRWDPAKAVANRKKHGVCFADAEAALYDPHALTLEDPDARGEQRFVSMGRGATGDILVVVYSWRDEHVRLISARRATRAEKNAYEKRL